MDLLVLGKEPIQPDQPAGQEARYTPEYEQLQAEIDKLSLPSASSGVDWRKVENLAGIILSQKSKDLAVASYLAVALIYNRQVEGLAIGLQIYRDLLENFWETLYPTKARMRGRVRTMEWWVEKMETALASLPPASFSPEVFQKIKENFDQIDDFISQNLEEPPALSPLRDYLRTIEETAIIQPAAEEKKVEEELPPKSTTTPSAPAREEPEVISSAQEAQRALNSVLAKLREIAAYLFQENMANPQAYRLNRMASWSIVDNLPPAADGKTKIPSPPGQIKNSLNELKAKGNYEALLKTAEGKISQFIFWLDLNRLVVEALLMLGPTYQAAAEAVKKETAYLISRLAGLEELAFADGTPFADSETKAWLKEIAGRTAVTLAAPLSSLASAGIQEDDLMGKEVEKAKELIKEGKVLEAISGLQQQMHKSSSGKEKILWRLAIAQLLLEMKKPRPARPYLEQILKDIDNYHLEEWDPDLALRGLKTIWLGWNNTPEPGLKEKLSDIIWRIAKLDLAEAMRLGLN
ncbi:MAG: type VI secretion system protein TssA [bacterium]